MSEIFQKKQTGAEKTLPPRGTVRVGLAGLILVDLQKRGTNHRRKRIVPSAKHVALIKSQTDSVVQHAWSILRYNDCMKCS